MPIKLGQQHAGPLTTQEAFAHCEKLAKTHYENFTVGSRFIPKDKRQHIYNIYAYCRFVDDLGDEAEGDRMALLDQWEAEVKLCYTSAPRHPILIALKETISKFQVPQEPFLKLIEANRMDQRTSRYPTYDDLLYYCQHSANPVGHMVLHLFGYRDEERQRLSDCTCTALQLTNFWQDIARDFKKGRIYLPLEDMDRFEYSEDELAQGVVNQNFVRLMAFQVERARAFFKEGLKLVEKVDGLLKIDLRLFSMGGMKVLEAIEKNGYDVFRKRPTLSKLAKVRLMASAVAGL